MTNKTKLQLLLFTLLTAILVLGTVLSARATDAHVLNVDGVEYAPDKVVGSGPTVHYNTPGTNPQAAFSERHVWGGNGSDNLPCSDGIHWIDNKNVLTISNCLEVLTSTTTTTSSTTTTSPAATTTPPTTTTTPPSTTTTAVLGTTTTQPESSTTTTTSLPSTTTLVDSTTSSIVSSTSSPLTTLPRTGANDELVVAAVAGGLLVLLGYTILAEIRRRKAGE